MKGVLFHGLESYEVKTSEEAREERVRKERRVGEVEKFEERKRAQER